MNDPDSKDDEVFTSAAPDEGAGGEPKIGPDQTTNAESEDVVEDSAGAAEDVAESEGPDLEECDATIPIERVPQLAADSCPQCALPEWREPGPCRFCGYRLEEQATPDASDDDESMTAAGPSPVKEAETPGPMSASVEEGPQSQATPEPSEQEEEQEDDVFSSAPPPEGAHPKGTTASTEAEKSSPPEEEVWTTAQPNPVAPPSGEADGTAQDDLEANSALDSGEHALETLGQALKAHRAGKKQRKRFLAFRRFIDELADAQDPLKRISRLARFTGDAEMGAAAAEHLVSSLDAGEMLESGELVYAMAAATQLDSLAARPHLIAYSRGAVDRMVSEGALPSIEEHFAMAGLEAIGNEDITYEPRAVFDEHQELVDNLIRLQDAGHETTLDTAISTVVKQYRARLEKVLPRRNAVAATEEGEPALAEGSSLGGNEVEEKAPEAPPRRVPAPSFVADFDDDIDPMVLESAKTPMLASLLGFIAIAAGIGMLVVGLKTHWGFVVLGPFWMVAGLGLWSDRRAGWNLGFCGYAANGAFLVWSGLAGELPPWLVAEGFVAGGIGSCLAAALLCIPAIRQHYRSATSRWVA